MGTIADALTRFRSRIPAPIAEREVLRVVASIEGDDQSTLLTEARNEVLIWARRRAGELLPQQAWAGETFESLAAGRTVMGTKVALPTGVLWALRCDDPDKQVPGRIWSTEITLGYSTEAQLLLSLRSVVNTNEHSLEVEPAVPGVILQIAQKCGLNDGIVPIRWEPHHVENEGHVDTIIEWLLSPSRRLPVIIASGDERSSNPQVPAVEVETLGKVLAGLAHVITLPASFTYRLGDRLGIGFRVFHGGVRVYEPGLSLDSDPRDHRLYLASAVVGKEEQFCGELRRSIARTSLRRTRLGHDVLSFAAVRSAAIKSERTDQIDRGASDSELLQAANLQNEALQGQVDALQGEADQALELSIEEAERAQVSEKQLYAAWGRIEALEAAIDASGADIAQIPQPQEWESFATWVDDAFAGRLSLTPSARRSIRKAAFEEIELACKAVIWLAGSARDRFLNGGGSLSNITIDQGLENAPCGSDEYQFDYQGRRLKANWHVKNGGNTRQPERCLRIYYTFDEQNRQIVVSDMPAHRKTGAS